MGQTASLEHIDSAKAAGLRYVSDSMPGIKRLRHGRGFSYVGADGQVIQERDTIKRFRSLVIPPAWTDVWICPLEDGHLQVTARDARGRKQYRYHPNFRQQRDGTKFERLFAFGDVVWKIRERVENDVQLPGLPREKVLATVVWLLEKTLIRVGTQEMSKANKSYGLTTLKKKHVAVAGDERSRAQCCRGDRPRGVATRQHAHGVPQVLHPPVGHRGIPARRSFAAVTEADEAPAAQTGRTAA